MAFQYADPNDGWKFVESDNAELGDDKEGKGKSDSSSGSTGGGASGGKGGSSSGSGGSGAGGSGSSGQNGGSGGGGKGSTPFGLSSDSPMLAPITAD